MQPYGKGREKRHEKQREKQREKQPGEVKDELVPRLDRQDETLRLMWKQMKGNGKLPIDD